MRCRRCRHFNPSNEPVCRRCGADLAEQVQVSAAIAPGRVIAGRYEVGHALGAGGMGVVFAARDRTLGRDVALKVVLPELALQASMARRIAAEAAAMARVSHPHVVSLLEVFEHEGLVVLVLELVSGGTLADRIEAGPTAPGEAVSLLRRILAGLDAIHALGLVHRDIKPTNILLTREGEPKITDLGIVYEAARTHFTATGAVLGTFAYMAPEQALARSVDARTDIYAAGVVLFELLTTQLPFPTEQDPLWWARTAAAQPPLALLPVSTPPELASVLGRALATDPDARYPTARDMATALEHCLGTPTVDTHARCFTCGMPVVYRAGEARIHCTHCGSTYELSTSAGAPAARESAPVDAGASLRSSAGVATPGSAPRPSGSATPIAAGAAAVQRAAGVTPRTRATAVRNWVVLVVALGVAGMVLGPVLAGAAWAGLYALMLWRSAGGGTISSLHSVTPFNSDLCWVQANSDGVEDLVVWSGAWNRAHVTVIDGATGKGLWSSPTVPHMADSFLHCSDPKTVIVSHKDFSVYAYDASSGRERWSTKLSDQAQRSAPGDGCMVFQTADQTTTGLSLATGARQSCQPYHKPSNYWDRGPDRAKQTMHIDGLDIVLQERSAGTPMLSLTASSGGSVVWHTELGVYTNSPYAMAGKVAAADSVIAVGGRVPASDIRVRLVGVAAKSGEILWSREEGNAAAVHFVESRANRFYVGFAQSVLLLEPATGKDQWKAREP